MEPNIVCIGGGTGLPNLLRGLKWYTGNITAIVTVADDGGSSGILRNELQMLPPGDIKNCLLALADTEPLMKSLFQYRFSKGSLKGHSFGNLFLAAMTEVLGDFDLAIRESSKVLAVRGKVLPSTLEDVILEAKFSDGVRTQGESKISNCNKRIRKIRLLPENVKPLPEALDAISNAQMIILGPGSLYTSIIPNLLVRDLTEAIGQSKAMKVYIVNVMTQPGETTGYTAYDHVKAIVQHSRKDIFQHVIVNTQKIPEGLAKRYLEDGAAQVICDDEKISALGYNVVREDIINPTDVVRHSPGKLAKVVMSLI